MSREERPPGTGRVRRSPTAGLAAIVVAIVAVLSLPSLLRRDADGPPPRPSPTPSPVDRGIDAPPLRGRLVYAAAAPDGRPGLRDRIVSFDLETGDVTVGPLIPTASVVVGVAPRTVVVIADVGRQRQQAFAIHAFRADARARPIARGSLLEPSSDGQYLLVVRPAHDPRCHGVAFEARTEVLAPRVAFPQGEAARLRGCGAVLSGAVSGTRVGVTILGASGSTRVVTVPGVTTSVARRQTLAAQGASILGIGPTGTSLFVRTPGRVDETFRPYGRLLVARLNAAPEPALRGFAASRILAWHPAGGIVVASGTLGGEFALWRINLATETAAPILPSNGFDLGTAFSGAAFDISGNAFGASAGVVIVASDLGTFPVVLPADAPTPQGPLDWLP
jgi:hypothetical protein